MQEILESYRGTTLRKYKNQTFKNLERFDIEKSTCDCGKEYDSYFKMFIPPQQDGEEPVEYRSTMCRECEEFEKHCEYIRNIEVENEKRRKRRFLEIFDEHSLINPKLKEASFDNYIPTSAELEKAKQITKRYAENFSKDNPVSLLLIGNYGTGKSHLSVSMTKGLMEKNVTCIFISTPKLLTKLRSTYNKGSEYTEEQIIESLTKVDCLVLDDIGSEQSGQKQDENNQTWATSKLFEIIDSRIGKHTIFTSNFTPEELQQRLGGRNFSRMMENTHVIKMYGDDYRLRRFK